MNSSLTLGTFHPLFISNQYKPVSHFPRTHNPLIWLSIDSPNSSYPANIRPTITYHNDCGRIGRAMRSVWNVDWIGTEPIKLGASCRGRTGGTNCILHWGHARRTNPRYKRDSLHLPVHRPPGGPRFTAVCVPAHLAVCGVWLVSFCNTWCTIL